MDSPLLTIQFASNQTVETMFARHGVTLTLTGKGVATGATAPLLRHQRKPAAGTGRRTGADARWQNGEQEATAAKFTYDPDRHLLTADDQVRVRWPNPPDSTLPPRQTFRNSFPPIMPPCK